MKNPTLADAKRLLKKNNPDLKALVVSWVKKPRRITNDRGCIWVTAKVKVSAEGYADKVMTISRDHDSLMIR